MCILMLMYHNTDIVIISFRMQNCMGFNYVIMWALSLIGQMKKLERLINLHST